jgi:hypothetical protein
MTPGLLTSRITKIKLHKLSLTNPATYLNKYKAYRNLFHKTVRASKKLHYEIKFKQYAKNPKKTWELLNELTNGSKKSVDISNLVINGNTINKPESIANEFNKFFCNCG